MELTIERRNLNLLEYFDIEYLVGGNTALLVMDSQEISSNENIKSIPMDDDESWKALENNQDDRNRYIYCYIKFHTNNDIHRQYKIIHITHIIVDECVINSRVFEYIFKIFIRQEDSTINNRLFIGNRDYKFTRDSHAVAKNVADYICSLFADFTASNICTKYNYAYPPLSILNW